MISRRALIAGAVSSISTLSLADAFELIINMKTANALRLTIAPTVLVRTDQIIN